MRFRLARWLDGLLPHACWAYLYSWSVRDDGYTFRQAVRSYPLCVDDVARGGGCWCGKNRPEPCGQAEGPTRLSASNEAVS